MRDMKKIFISLLLIGTLLISSCSPKIYYFQRDTICPQCVVDSLLGPKTSSYLDWTGFKVEGINQGDSTIISTYVTVIDNQTISVIDYENSDLSTVTEKRRK